MSKTDKIIFMGTPEFAVPGLKCASQKRSKRGFGGNPARPSKRTRPKSLPAAC